jgi:two-component system sensor histidine kinase ChvG
VKSKRRWLPFTSSLTRRILAVNLLAPVILVGGLLYLDRYQEGLEAQALQSLQTRAEIFAAALGEGAVIEDSIGNFRLAREPARAMLRRLARPAGVRARLFIRDGDMLADTRMMAPMGGEIRVERLPPPPNGLEQTLRQVYRFLTSWQPSERKLPRYVEAVEQYATHYPEVQHALQGEIGRHIRSGPNSGLVLSVALPVQRYKEVVGAILLTSSGEEIERSLYDVRMAIVEVFGISLLVTVLLSLYLAGTIARPIRRLALAAEHVRQGQGHGRHQQIPDMSARGDEIGELSGALREMTAELWARMDAIEAFAADVAHEIKNPLTSLRSAVETAARVTDPSQQQKLLAIIQDDVQRLDRLISDISDASRLDAELSRAEATPVDLARMLETLADVYETTGSTQTGARPGVHFALDVPQGAELTVSGIEGRLVQVVRNLIANALSFSPQGGTIRLSGRRERNHAILEIEDDGPGIPDNKLEAIFERFYTERPLGEKFGTHSGLGLSISKQIVEAHRGTIRAENRHDSAGRVSGARFTVTLPV